MVKTEIFERVLADVCEVTEIPERDIMSRSRREEIVDARHLLAAELSRGGYYPEMIAGRLHISGRAVRNMLRDFPSRAGRSPGLEMCRRRVEEMRNNEGTEMEA